MVFLSFRCKKYDVDINKVYTKTHRDKFRWAIEMVGPNYKFDKSKDVEDSPLKKSPSKSIKKEDEAGSPKKKSKKSKHDDSDSD